MKTTKTGSLALVLSSACLGAAGLPGDWQIRKTPVMTHLTAAASAPGQLIAVGQAGTILASGNGSAWDVVPYAGTGDFLCVTFAKGRYIAGGTFECLLATSPDGVHWTTLQTTPGPHAIFGVTYGGGRFVAVGRRGVLIPTLLSTSTNGINWQPVNVPPTTNSLRAVTFGNGKYVAVGERGTIITSADGTTWTLQISGTEHLLRSVIFTGREFLAGGDSSILLTSGDGISWVTVPFSSFDVRALATSGTAVVGVGALGTEGRLQASTNGLSWSAAAETFATRLNGVMHFAFGKFFAVGNNGLIVESGAVANAPVNVWIKSTNGYWHEGPWSLGHMPSWSDTKIVFTNGGSKTLEINATTTRDYPESLRIRELALFWQPEDATNTLLLNNAGWDVPLKIDNGLRVPPNFSLRSFNSALEGSGMELSGNATFSDTRLWFTGSINVGAIGPANVVQTNGYLAASGIGFSPYNRSTWAQYGGTNELHSLGISAGNSYELDGVLFAESITLVGTLTLAGGSVSNTNITIYSGRLNAIGNYDLGKLILRSTATVDCGVRSTVLRFADSSDASWETGSLTVTNWKGVDQFFIGHNQAGLTAAQLSRIQFVNPSGLSPGLYRARITSAGEVVPVPRIINYQRSANQLVLSWPEDYRLLTATNVAGPYSLITNAISPYNASYHTDPQRFFIIRNEN